MNRYKRELERENRITEIMCMICPDYRLMRWKMEELLQHDYPTDKIVKIVKRYCKDGLYIKVYADDDPLDKAEKLYQICDSNEALSDVAKCIQEEYLDEPSAEGEWIDVNGDGSLWRCNKCKDTACCDGNYCPTCGAKMKGGDSE